MEVTWTDQEKINQFSRLNTRQTEAESQLEQLRQEKEQCDEVYEELEMLELNEGVDDEDLDDDHDEDKDNDEEEELPEGKKKTKEDETGFTAGRSLPFKIGDAFVYVTLEKGIKLLDQEKERLEAEIVEQERQISECEKGMKSLKVELYAKFGSNISE